MDDNHGGAAADFPAELSSPAKARQFVCSHLDGRIRPEGVEAAVLMVSELVANAVIHAHSTVRVALSVDDVVRVEVSDRSHAVPVRRADRGLGEHGRGVVIVDQMSSAWGVVHGSAGKTVWFTLDHYR